jgi:hypothetical protein
MAIKKIALIDPQVLDRETDGSLVKTAAVSLSLENNSEGAKVIQAEMEKHKTALFFKAKAIVADEVNSNGDHFSWSELQKSYRSFIGVPFFTNHNNQDVENARGKIVWADLNPRDKAVYVVGYVDAEAYPHICRGIKEDYMSGVSMGCSVDFSVCSICKNKAASVEEYCPHIKNRKGRKFSGTAKNVQTGEVQTFKEALVYEENFGIRFIELSGVADPACRSCRIQGVYDQQDVMERTAKCLDKAAYIENSIRMIKESELVKTASQAEVDQLEQTLTTLETISTNLIKNRKNVEMEFAADLVKILSELQTFTDELIGAGYGQLQDTPGAIPGVEGAPPEAAPAPVPGVAESPPIAGGTQPVGVTQPVATMPGAISGSPASPLVRTPAMPTAPVRPMAESTLNLGKIAEKVADLNTFFEGDDNMRRRLPTVAAKEKQEVMETLSTSWKEKQANPENNEASHFDLIKGGGNMTTVNASRTEAPDQITERQLDAAGGYHPREDAVRDEVTQKQLNAVRKDDEKTVVTERQLDAKREDSTPTVITQKQLDPERKDDEKTVITQVQIESDRRNDEKQVITEKQLEDKSGSGEWKGAAEVVKSVIRVLATAMNNEEATAEQAIKAVSSYVSGITTTAALLVELSKPLSVADTSLSKTAGERKNAYLKAAILNGLKQLVASDSAINPEDVVYVLEAVVEQPEVSVKSLTEMAREVLEENSKNVRAVASKKTQILTALAAKKDLPDFIQKKIDEKEGKDGDKEEKKDDSKEARIEERQNLSKLTDRKPNYLIEASMEEIGLTSEVLEKDQAEAKKVILAFVKGVSATQGKKFAGITNVTVDGSKVHIAIQWDENEGEVDLDIPDADTADLVPESPAPEGDITGEGMDSLVGGPAAAAGAPPPPPPAPAAPPPPPPAAAPAGMPAPLASAKKGLVKEAQMPGAPQQPGSPPAAGPVPSPAPQDEAPFPALTGEDEEGVGEADKPGQFPAGAVCHFCGSKDVDIGKEGRGPGVSECNNCGAVWETMVTISILNPEDVEFKGEGESKVEEPEEPELPSMPVAARSVLSAQGLHKVAELEKTHGHVCPGCGQTECKPTKLATGRTEYICPACETKATKEIFVDPDKPKQAIIQVTWDMDPKKLTGGCETCKESAKKFAARLKVAGIMKTASVKQRETPFPRANCIERIARKWGINAVATFGPCKGKQLADCVCKELEAYGFRSIRKMEKLAAVYAQEDPMSECLKDHLSKGYKQATAESICNTLKKLYASAAVENPYILAWADEPGLNVYDLMEMDGKLHATAQAVDIAAPVAPTGVEELDDIGAPLDEAPEAETISVEIPVEVAQDIADQIEGSTEAPAAVEDVAAVPGVPDIGSGAEVEVGQPELTASTEGKKSMQKEAKTPTMVEHVETEVKAGVPRGSATLGNESAQNIDVKEAKPEIPRKDQTLGNEGKDNINVTLKEVDVPTGNAYLGGEAEAQKGLPENVVKSKGTIIAEQAAPITKEAKSPTMVEHVETEVKAGIPRKEEYLGNESKADSMINESLKGPEIPRKEQYLGEESKADSLINKTPAQVDVPEGGGYIGHEQEIQKGMPENTVKSKGTVIADSDKRIQHEARLREARREKARMVAAQYLGLGIITKEQYPQLVEDLAQLPINRIDAFAEMTLGKVQVKTAAAPTSVLTAAVVVESKAPEAPPQEKSQTEKLADVFTIGNRDLSRDLRRS